MNNDKSLVLGFCWYDRTQWEQLKAAVPDTMDDSYAQWRRNAARAFNKLRRDGHNIKKVNINVSAFLEWCKTRDLEPDSDGRTQYVAWVLRQRDKN